MPCAWGSAWFRRCMWAESWLGKGMHEQQHCSGRQPVCACFGLSVGHKRVLFVIIINILWKKQGDLCVFVPYYYTLTLKRCWRVSVFPTVLVTVPVNILSHWAVDRDWEEKCLETFWDARVHGRGQVRQWTAPHSPSPRAWIPAWQSCQSLAHQRQCPILP